MIPALAELFLTHLKILLNLRGMKLLVCCPTCARGAGGTGALADRHTGGALAAALLSAPSQTSLSVLKGECTTEVSWLCEGRSQLEHTLCSIPPEAREYLFLKDIQSCHKDSKRR